MNTVRQLGYLALGTRFRMLTDSLMLDVDKIYKSLRLDFEPRLFLVFYQIVQRSPVTITEIAEQIGFTQPAVTQTVNALIEKKLVKADKGKSDSRKKMISVTAKGSELVLKLIPVWQDIESAAKELLNSTGYDILFIMGKLESEINNKSIYSRVIEKVKERQLNEIRIFEYEPKYKKQFYELNKEWLLKYFEIESKDKTILENPEREIIKKGGYIFFAEYENEIAGTAALIKHKGNIFELAKMAVTEKAQGKQIGKKLGQTVLQKLKKLNAEKVFLETNSKLTPAINLYKGLGFEETEMKEPSEYKRATLRMDLNLKKVKHSLSKT